MNAWDMIAGSGLAGLGLKGLFGSTKGNPANSAMPYLNQIPGIGQQYFNPYIQQGQQVAPNLQAQYGQLTNDPTAFYNQLMQGYKPSAGYTKQSQDMLKAAENSAAASGFAGTNLDQQQRAQLVQSLMGKDMQQYLQNVMGLYGTGLQGQQHLYDTGYNASGQLADFLGQGLGAQSALSYAGDAFKRAQRNQLMNALLGLGGEAMYLGMK